MSTPPFVMPDEFEAYFRALHAVDGATIEAFPWQRSLAQRVLTEGWPEVISLPTAAGKTACIDIAVFALACEAHIPETRRMPLRIFFVVDRRVVVDEAYLRARRIAQRLLHASDGVLRRVADALRALGVTEEDASPAPLHVSVMRGGTWRDTTWARTPTQPTVCVSTVDQVGSRLLFRGYGLGQKTCNTLPVHAGLVGNDALVVLDEAHLSQPFEETLRAIEGFKSRALPLPLRWKVVSMSATPGSAKATFGLTEDDRRHATLARRVEATKRTRLVEVPGAGEGDPKAEEEAAREGMVQALVDAADALHAARPTMRSLGVVVNRVATARAVFERLRKAHGADNTLLLTGRARPVERDAMIERHRARMFATPTRGPATTNTLFVVATQCIEVGADLDFDALVTELASLDALRQRFGRLNRLGLLDESPAVVVARKDHTTRGYDDFVYGTALAPTWKWLKDRAAGGGKRGAKAKGTKRGDASSEVDMGVVATEAALPPPDALAEMLSPRLHAPVLLPGHLDLWAQTSPMPAISPDVAMFLHGPARGPDEVNLIWRADLVEGDAKDNALERQWTDIVALCPPSSPEAMPLPLHIVRAWLGARNSAQLDDSDQQGARSAATHDTRGGRSDRPALRWRGVEDSAFVVAAQVVPGDTLVVPATYGGVDAYGWNPSRTEPADDLGDIANLLQRGTLSLRVDPNVAAGWRKDRAAARTSEQLRAMLDASSAERELRALAADVDVRDDVRALAWALATLRVRRRRPTWYPHAASTSGDSDEAPWGVWTSWRPLPRDTVQRLRDAGFRVEGLTVEDAMLDLAEDDTASVTGAPLTLAQHSGDVERLARTFAQRCGLPTMLVDDLALAGWFHDVGKADRRFQVMLHHGDEVRYRRACRGEGETPPLAKSGMDPRDREAFILARTRSGYPMGARHEALSLAMIETSPEALATAHDGVLVMHLVASHHGCARPFVPWVLDPEPDTVELSHGDRGHRHVTLRARSDHGREALDAGVADRYWELTERYGWYGLAYLEAILRLADHRASEMAAQNSKEEGA